MKFSVWGSVLGGSEEQFMDQNAGKTGRTGKTGQAGRRRGRRPGSNLRPLSKFSVWRLQIETPIEVQRLGQTSGLQFETPVEVQRLEALI